MKSKELNYFALMTPTFIIVWTVFFHSACQTGKKPLQNNVATIDGTHLHLSASANEPSPENLLPERVAVSKRLLRLFRVRSSYAAIRQAPGSKYPIKKTLLPYGTQALVFKSEGSWFKVLVPDLRLSGWVHKGHLLPELKEQDGSIEVLTKDLPLVSAVKTINTISSFDHKKVLQVKIPYSSKFFLLKQSERKVLVWLPKENSVAWIEKSFVI